MSQPFGHLLIAHDAFKRTLPDFAEAYPGHISFGSQGPDMFYALRGGIWGYKEVADAIHGCNTLIFYAKMLQKIKEFDVDSREHQAGRAYAHSFYSHVVTDCIFHPYVNRLADNNWTHGGDSKEGMTKHKEIETKIDDCLLGVRSITREDFRFGLNCSDPNNLFKLDPAIISLLDYAFHDAYVHDIDLGTMIDSHTLEHFDHPFNEAYRAYLEWNGFAQVLATLPIPINLNYLLSMRGPASLIEAPNYWDEDELKAINSERLPWYNAPSNNDLIYTAQELYDIAVNAAANVIEVGERFLASQDQDALMFLMQSGHPLLVDDYNLDTGLPSRYNDNEENRHQDSQIRFAFEVSLLKDNYSRFG